MTSRNFGRPQTADGTATSSSAAEDPGLYWRKHRLEVSAGYNMTDQEAHAAAAVLISMSPATESSTSEAQSQAESQPQTQAQSQIIAQSAHDEGVQSAITCSSCNSHETTVDILVVETSQAQSPDDVQVERAAACSTGDETQPVVDILLIETPEAQSPVDGQDHYAAACSRSDSANSAVDVLVIEDAAELTHDRAAAILRQLSSECQAGSQDAIHEDGENVVFDQSSDSCSHSPANDVVHIISDACRDPTTAGTLHSASPSRRFGQMPAQLRSASASSVQQACCDNADIQELDSHVSTTHHEQEATPLSSDFSTTADAADPQLMSQWGTSSAGFREQSGSAAAVSGRQQEAAAESPFLQRLQMSRQATTRGQGSSALSSDKYTTAEADAEDLQLISQWSGSSAGDRSLSCSAAAVPARQQETAAESAFLQRLQMSKQASISGQESVEQPSMLMQSKWQPSPLCCHGTRAGQ